MAYHVTKLGCFGPKDHADIHGYVPERGDGPWDLNWDHGTEKTHDDDGELTEYGEWWEERWPEIVDAAVKATAEAERRVGEWRSV